MLTAAIILQARMGSRRLPGKVLTDLAGRTLLGHCIWRLSASGIPVIVATTTRREDDGVEREAAKYDVRAFRGSDEDVLARYVAAAQAFGVAEIVRATADNPAVDLDGPARVLAQLRRMHADYVVECGLPHGAAVEAVTRAALERAAEETRDPYDHEHVTPYVRRTAGFRSLSVMAPGHLRNPHLRVTIDTPEDLRTMRALLSQFRNADVPVPLAQIIAKAAMPHATGRTEDVANVRQGSGAL